MLLYVFDFSAYFPICTSPDLKLIHLVDPHQYTESQRCVAIRHVGIRLLLSLGLSEKTGREKITWTLLKGERSLSYLSHVSF